MGSEGSTRTIVEGGEKRSTNSDASIRYPDDRHMSEDPHQPTESPRDSVLVVLDEDDPASTLRASLRDTDPTRAAYHLLMVVPTRSYEAKRRAIADADVPWKYTIVQARENARQNAQRVGREFFGDGSDSFRATGAVGREREEIRQIVRTHDFTTVFVPDRERSLLQRFLGGGDLAATLEGSLPDGVSVETVDTVARPSGQEAESESTLDSYTEFTTGSN